MPVLEVRDLEVKIGLQQILFGLSLDVEPKAIVSVLGSNGVGKTTLMRAVSGIYNTTAGTVRLAGEDITNLASHKVVAKGLCQAPEGRLIFANMTVLENLRIGGRHRPAAEVEEDVKASFKLFPVLEERRKQKAGSLSGGEQQMLCIGRALMGRPKLLLLDEPSLGLAPMLVKQIFDLIVQIRSETAILLVEQNARAALAVADYAYIMEGGRFILQGPARELRDDERIRAAYLGGRVH